VEKILKVLAIFGNLVAIVGIFLLWANEHPQGVEILILTGALAVPLLNLWLFWQGPDLEERRLRRQVNKAELRERLKQLGQG